MRLAKTGALRRPGRPSGLSSAVLATLIVGAGLSACTTPARQVDVKLPNAYEAPTGAPLASQALDQWWTAFNDPVLNDLITTALEKAPDARMAAAKLEEARAVRTSQIRQIYIPQTPLTGSAKRTDTDIIDQSGTGGFTLGGVTKTYAANFDVSWELDLIGRRGAARRVVDNDLAAPASPMKAPAPPWPPMSPSPISKRAATPCSWRTPAPTRPSPRTCSRSRTRKAAEASRPPPKAIARPPTWPRPRPRSPSWKPSCRPLAVAC